MLQQRLFRLWYIKRAVFWPSTGSTLAGEPALQGLGMWNHCISHGHASRTECFSSSVLCLPCFQKKKIICFGGKIVLWAFNLFLISICFAFLPYFCCSLTLRATPAWKSREQLMCWYVWHYPSENEIRNVPKIMWRREGFFRRNQCTGACISSWGEGFSYYERLGEEASQSLYSSSTHP